MRKYLLLYIFATAMAAMPFADAKALTLIELIDNTDIETVEITVKGSVVRVTGAQGMEMSVYSIAGGVPVVKTRIESNDWTCELSLHKGIYIVQVGKLVRKIVIR